MITLRRFTLADATDEYWAALRDPDVNRHLDSRPWSYTRAGLEKRLADLEAGAGWMFSVRGGGELHYPVGTCTIRYEGEPWHGVAVFGLMIFPAYHGKGYGTATIRAATDHAFGRLYLRKLWAGVHRPNVASSKAFERAGWKLEGVFGAHRREDTGSAVLDVDVLIFGTWRDKWLAHNAGAGPRLWTTEPAYPTGSSPVG